MNVKKFTFVVVFIVLMLASTATILAKGTFQTIEVIFNSINIKVNGKPLAAENILYEGTTYVPIRGVAQMLGKEVEWNGVTNTAEIKDILVDKKINQNTATLLAEADFEVEIDKGINWVPVNILGKSRYSNEEVLNFERNAYYLKGKISNLYELIQYIQLHKMETINGNLVTHENNIRWEHTRTAETTIEINQANCLSISELANFILQDDYEEIGFVHYGEERGGHIINYIKQNNKYYVIDLTSYKTDFLAVGKETGNTKDYYYRNSIANLHEVESLEEYVAFYIKAARMSDPVIFVAYTSKQALPVGTVDSNNTRYICYDKNYSINVLYNGSNDKLQLKFVNGPTIFPKKD